MNEQKNKEIEIETFNKNTKKTMFKKGKIKKKIILYIFLGLILLVLALMVVLFSSKTSVEKLKDSVVMIEVYDENGDLLGSGSGFSAYKEDWIVTNFHVIEGAYSILVITDDKQEYEVKDVIVFNKKEDLAILSIDGKLDTLKLGNGNNIKTKDKVTAIGSPMGELNTVSEGIISNSDEKNVIRTTAPISHGSSGGVLLNSKNLVIGITSAGYDEAQNLNFAININVLNKIYEAYKNEKYFKINNDNYKNCIPNIVNHNTTNELSMKKKCTDSKYYNYTVSDMTAFYKATNSYEIFNTAMYKIGLLNGFNANYKSLTISEQKLASQYYTEILKYEDCDTNAPSGCTINNVSVWNAEQMVLELDIITAYELAIFKVEIEKYKGTNNIFNFINNFPISSNSKSILSLLYGNFSPSDLSDQDARNVINYVGNLNVSVQDKGKILEYLGYRVDGEKAYW